MDEREKDLEKYHQSAQSSLLWLATVMRAGWGGGKTLFCFVFLSKTETHLVLSLSLSLSLSVSLLLLLSLFSLCHPQRNTQMISLPWWKNKGRLQSVYLLAVIRVAEKRWGCGWNLREQDLGIRRLLRANSHFCSTRWFRTSMLACGSVALSIMIPWKKRRVFHNSDCLQLKFQLDYHVSWGYLKRLS